MGQKAKLNTSAQGQCWLRIDSPAKGQRCYRRLFAVLQSLELGVLVPKKVNDIYRTTKSIDSGFNGAYLLVTIDAAGSDLTEKRLQGCPTDKSLVESLLAKFS